MLATILIVILILMLLGACPRGAIVETGATVPAVAWASWW